MDWEINLGGIKIKSGFIFVFLAFAGSVAGGVWTASELYGRLVAVEDELASLQIPDLAPLNEDIIVIRQNLEAADELISARIDTQNERLTVFERSDVLNRTERIETRIEDQDLGQLQGKLAQLQTNLENIIEAQRALAGFSEKVDDSAREVERISKNMASFEQDMDDVWTALDELSY